MRLSSVSTPSIGKEHHALEQVGGVGNETHRAAAALRQATAASSLIGLPVHRPNQSGTRERKFATWITEKDDIGISEVYNV
jgi:hypothetical protein